MTAPGPRRLRRALAPGISRAGLLHAIRLGLAVAVLVLSATAGDALPIDLEDVAVPTAAYLLVSVAVEIARVRGGAQASRAVKIMLLGDLVYLSAMVVLAGGAASLLGFVIPVHLVSASLLLSHQTGLRLAVGYSLLLIGGHYVPALQNGESTSWASGNEASLAVVGFWAVAIVVAVFAGMNERELLRGRSQLEGLSAMAAQLKAAETAEEVARVLTAGIASAFEGVRAAAILEEGPRRWVLGTSMGGSEPVPTSGSRPFTPRTAVELVGTLDAVRDPLLAEQLPDARNVALLPIVIDDAPLGVVAVECGGPVGARVATPAVAMLEHYASHAALALRNTRLLADITRMALSDPLTGLPNRRSFQESFSRELARAQRNGDPVSAVMVDVDHFKKVNDEHGHEVGDDVLRHVGERLPRAARPMDVCARLGGEEFAVLLPGCTPVEALQVAERLRAAVASYETLDVTASAGVATLGVHVDEPNQLLAAADEALYAAKHAGRDRVAISSRVPDDQLSSVGSSS